jgi:hypothetical protein
MESDTGLLPSSGITRVIAVLPTRVVLPGQWDPVVGSETTGLLASLGVPLHSKAVLSEESRGILARCIPPGSESATRTGLVVGQVQSGKTMSFTTLAALARDNGFQVVIVITGVSVALFDQSTGRLRHDLRLDSRGDRAWQFFGNPTPSPATRAAMSAVLHDWQDTSVLPRQRQTLLVTVMKNGSHLRNLARLLRELRVGGAPALIVDDEVDQAGMNTQVGQGGESSIHRCLADLRRQLPLHTYVGYTATPQAPLLINIIDTLAPDFARVLTSGPGYVGGRQFFLSDRSLARSIPNDELPTRDALPAQPPDTLLLALRLFFLGVAAGHLVAGAHGNRSMLVHPSQLRISHDQYAHWITQIRTQWLVFLDLPTEDPDRSGLVDTFRLAYADLAGTVPRLPLFNDLMGTLAYAIRHTRVEVVNASRGRTPPIDWQQAYAYILVGGQAMDRGFTVQGLTVTYMPRPVGIGIADTVQQRARFFGYKQQYLGYCRAFFESSALSAYVAYVEHEDDIHMQLRRFADGQRPLREWKRAFFLTPELKPTRDCVLGLDYMRGMFSATWFAPHAPHDSAETARANWDVVNGFLSTLVLVNDEGHPGRTEYQRHQMCRNVSLDAVYASLLTQLRYARTVDSQASTGLLLQIRRYLDEHNTENCTVYCMSRDDQKWLVRDRTISESEEVPNLFQGPNPVEPRSRQGSIYPGDAALHGRDELTVQVHNVRVRGRQSAGDIVPAVTVWVPARMARPWLVQATSGGGA